MVWNWKPRQLHFHYSMISHYSNCFLFVTDNNGNYKDNIHGTYTALLNSYNVINRYMLPTQHYKHFSRYYQIPHLIVMRLSLKRM